MSEVIPSMADGLDSHRVEAVVRADCEAVMADADERSEIADVQATMEPMRAW